MTKVTIIEVNLGISIEELIEEDVTKLSEGAQKELDTAINTAKKVKALKEEKNKKTEETKGKIDIVMATAYDKLIKAGANGITADDILNIISGEVPTISAFTLRMKTLLRKNGNPYQISRVKINKIPVYVFTPFNTDLINSCAKTGGTT